MSLDINLYPSFLSKLPLRHSVTKGSHTQPVLSEEYIIKGTSSLVWVPTETGVG